MSEKPILLIQTGQPPAPILAEHGPFSAMIQRISQVAQEDLWVVDAQHGEALPPPDAVSGAVITGSAAMVSDRESWSENTAAWIRQALTKQIPLFGICYGHQLMAHALGGKVGYHPEGREIGTRAVARSGPAHSASSLPPQFPAHLIHQQTIQQTPPQAQVLAHNDHDAHQLLRYGTNSWSTQFHPEFNAAIMQSYLTVFRDQLAKESFDVDALVEAVQETPDANTFLRDFMQGCLSPSTPEE